MRTYVWVSAILALIEEEFASILQREIETFGRILIRPGILSSMTNEIIPEKRISPPTVDQASSSEETNPVFTKHGNTDPL